MLVGLVACGCSPDPIPATPTPAEPPLEATWTAVSAHPCALHRDGGVRCWNRNTWEPDRREVDSPFPVDWFVEQVGGYSYGVRSDTGVAEAWFTPGSSAEAIEASRLPPPVALVAGSQYCGMTFGGGLVEWGTNPLPHNQSAVLLIADESRCTVLRSSGWLTSGPSGPYLHTDVVLADPEEVVDVATIYTHACWIRAGEIECEISELVYQVPPPPLPILPNPPYVALDASGPFLCAQRESGVIDCSDSEDAITFDFGPIVDFDIVAHWVGGSDVSVGPEATLELSICALTAEDRIVCEGPRYSPTLLEKIRADGG